MLDLWLMLTPILQEWNKDFPKIKIEQISFELSDTMEGVRVLDVNTHKFRLPHGLCLPHKNKVLINPQFWNDSNEWQKRKVIYHEIGHCALMLQHDVSDRNIMDSNIHTANKSNWRSLVNKFKREKVNVGH